MICAFQSEMQIHLAKTQVDMHKPLILLVHSNFLQKSPLDEEKPGDSGIDNKVKLILHFSVYNNKTCKFITIASFLSASNVSCEVVVACVKYLQDTLGEHTFLPKRILLDEPGQLDKKNFADVVAQRLMPSNIPAD